MARASVAAAEEEEGMWREGEEGEVGEVRKAEGESRGAVVVSTAGRGGEIEGVSS